MEIQVKFDAQRIIDRIGAIPGKVVAQALPAAINKVLDRGRTQTVKEIALYYKIKQKLIRARTRSKRATWRQPEARFSLGVLPIRTGKIGVPRQTKRGARVGAHAFPGAFVATMRSGHVGIFKRKGQPRLPIKEQTVSLSPQAEQIARRKFREVMSRDFSRLFRHELEYRLKQRR